MFCLLVYDVISSPSPPPKQPIKSTLPTNAFIVLLGGSGMELRGLVFKEVPVSDQGPPKRLNLNWTT